jgi:DNA-binding transcriptional ArsR family regulator
MRMSEGSESPSFDWEALVPLLVHPMRVQIVEALVWIGAPLSASDLRQLLGERLTLRCLSYHLNRLVEAGAIEKVSERPVRGTLERLYSI